MLRTVLGVIALVLVTALVGGILAARKQSAPPSAALVPAAPPPRSPAAPPPAAPVAQQPVAPSAVPVDAVKLWRAYEANEVAADSLYKGKLLDVSGVVAAVEKDAFGSMILGLRSPNQFMPTRATMRESEYATMAQLSKGTRVTIACLGAGKILGFPILDDCTFRPAPTGSRR